MQRWRRLQHVIYAAIVLAGSPAVAQDAEQQRTTRIHGLVEAAQAELGLPAVSVAVVHGRRIIFMRGYGMASLEHMVLAQPATAYRTASVTKPITAVAVLQLVEAGALDLATSIRAYVPALPATYDGVTLRDLLRHTGGVRHYGPGEFISTRHCERLADALAIFASDPLEHRPGEKITYSSYGYTLLGLAIESVSGLSYVEYLDRNILQPAGMRSTHVDDLRLIPGRAAGYDRDERGELRNAALLDTSCRIPAGGFVSTVEDLSRFAIALNGGVLVPMPAVHELMRSHLTPEIIANTLAGIELPPGYEPPGMGFGWAISPASGTAYHGGNQPGASSMLHHSPGRNLTVVIMSNLGGVGDHLTRLAEAISEAAAAAEPPRR